MSEVEIFRIVWIICMLVNFIIMYKKKTLSADGTLFTIIWGPIVIIAFGYMCLFKKFNILQPLTNVPKSKNELRYVMAAYLAFTTSMLTVIAIMLLYLPIPK